MSKIFKRLFAKSKKNEVSIDEPSLFKLFIDKVNNLTNEEMFISRKHYLGEIDEYIELLNEVRTYQESDLLQSYCSIKNYQLFEVEEALEFYKNLNKVINEHNEKFISKKLIEDKVYLDNILKQDDPNILLDEEQRKVILNDEDYCLVIAGAGAGKTTTIAAKVKYLVEKRNVDPKSILVISFTNKAVNELKDRIVNKLQIDCPVTTFHACGNAIIRKTQDEKLNVVTEGALFNIVRNYIYKNIYNDKTALKNLILFFGYYIDIPFEGSSVEEFFDYNKYNTFSTLKGNLGEVNQQIIKSRKKTKLTINNEHVKSYEEVQIANFLYLHGIDYEYEKAYPYHIPGATKIYTPDFHIVQDGKHFYLEHFGISESGTSSRYSELELMKYKGQIADKILIHQKHNTNLIMTYSIYNDKRPLLDHLKEELIKNGIKLNPLSDEDVYIKLTKIEDNKYFNKLTRLICKFITNFKTKDYQASDFNRLRNSTKNVRSRLFLDICEKAYLEYERILKEKNAVDFEDMINESARLLREVKELNQKLNFDYIIVDEYQDISRQRFNLTKELSEITNAKIIAVGDDWQSIYAFAGSEIELFTKFKEEMGYAEILHITHTYRNSQELIDIAGDFIQKNPSQIRKRLISPKSIKKPIVMFSYSDDYSKNKISGQKGVTEEKAELLEDVLGRIIQTNGINSNILILGRYGFDGFQLGETNYFTYINGKLISKKYPNLKITFMTVHSSKGLTYDNVVIINAANAVYGFPAQIENDPVLNFVIHNDRSYDYAEERRLFYVALTRTRNRVFILTPKLKPSRFVLELLNYDNVILHGKINKNYVEEKKYDKSCPVCNYPLQLKVNKTYGLKLYMCTNEPEICDFMTNDIKGGANSIRVCPVCIDGFLIVKNNPKQDTLFLGCTNYDSDIKCTCTQPLLN